MAKHTKKDVEFDARNASVLAELAVDPLTTDHSRVAILNLLLEQNSEKDFFATIFRENLSLGECVECGHQSHWLIPEDVLNTMGWISHNEDPRVPAHTTKADCETYQEACGKKRVIY